MTGFSVFLVLLALYLLPSIIAVSRNNRNCVALICLNVLLGWTLLGWVGALVWSLINPKETVVAN